MGIIRAIKRLFIWARYQLVKWLYRMRTKLRVHSLRAAIVDADKIKEETDRKAMVVLNTHSGNYEAMQKKMLKRAAKQGKNKSNKKMTDGRKKMMKKPKKKIITIDQVKQIEKKSLYVTE